jgi:dual specificity protein kinase YAK1
MCAQQVARLLNDTYDPDDAKHIVRLMDCFPAHNHLCLVFELLSINIYELLKTNQFRGLPLPMIRSFTKQVCCTISLSSLHGVMCQHCYCRSARAWTCL